MDQLKPIRFITFEGGEGAGKTTLIAKVESKLRNEGFEVVLTREPGGSLLGESIRSWLLDRDTQVNVGKKAELLLFLASRAQHLEEIIIPSLQAGKVVLCDRFNDSTIVYQGVGRKLGLEYVEQMCQMVCGEVIPGLTFYLDLDPLIGLKRTRFANKENAAAGHMDRIESEQLSFHRHVQEGFKLLAQQNPKRIVTIDATQTPQAVFQEAFQILNRYLK